MNENICFKIFFIATHFLLVLVLFILSCTLNFTTRSIKLYGIGLSRGNLSVPFDAL